MKNIWLSQTGLNNSLTEATSITAIRASGRDSYFINSKPRKFSFGKNFQR